MKIVIFTHPDFIDSTSMPRFANMIIEGMRARGHEVNRWTAKPFFYRLPVCGSIKKWFGYIDQYILFPLHVLFNIYTKNNSETLYVFSDQALGPWVTLVKKYPHVIHVHDFMAYHSANDKYSENPTSKTGKLYQKYIKNGFSKGKCFISVSKNTKKELEAILDRIGDQSFVIYNALNPIFKPMQTQDAFKHMVKLLPRQVLESGFLLHVGGNQWYKNRIGVLEIYDAYLRKNIADHKLPLVMIGSAPTVSLKSFISDHLISAQVYFLSGLSDEQVCAAYSLATLFLFPSLAEGFGWPIAEAMACGCPVITTNEAPMTEVGGDAAYYIDRRPSFNPAIWAEKSAYNLFDILQNKLQLHKKLGLDHVKQFDAESTISAYEEVYQHTLKRNNQ